MLKKYITAFLKYMAIFAVTAALAAFLLVLSALIPDSVIKGNMQSSADYLCEKEVFFYQWDKEIKPSMIDRYADSILLNIAYHFDSSDPIKSVIRSDYYFTEYQNENNNLRDAVSNDLPANQQYMRYWHGSAAVVLAAHAFTDIRGMYIISAIVLAVLTALLLFVLIKNRAYTAAVGLAAALVAVGIWFVPYSLEYIWVFVVAEIVSILAVIFAVKGNTAVLGVLFLISGIVTNFLDFLTCETITVLVPLLLVISIRHSKGAPAKENVLLSVKSAVLWGVGYAGMWVLKWLVAAIVTGEDVMPYITGHIAERVADTGSASFVVSALEGWLRNLGCLFPVGYGAVGIIATVVLGLGVLYLCFVYRKKGIDGGMILLCAIIGFAPFIRFTILNNHSYLHYFFAYRALAATVLALCLIIAEIIGKGRAKNDIKKRKRA